MLSPVLYLGASMLASVGCVWTMVYYLSGRSWIPELAFFVIPFVVVGAVLVPCAWGLLHLERLRRPALLDHIRHCAFLYLGLLILIGSWARFLYRKGEALALVEFGVFFYASLAILVDALVLVYWRRPTAHPTFGSAP